MQIEVKGRFFKYRSGIGAIRVRASGGGYVDLLPGQGVRNVAFDSLTVQDRSGLQNVGVIVAGDFDFQDDRISGTVDVVDGGRARTIGGVAFMGYANAGSAAGQYSTSQLWNPPGSGVRLVVEQVSISSNGVGDSVVISGGNAPCASKRMNGISKRIPGAGVARGECRYEGRATRQADGYCAIPVSAGALINVKPTEPWVVEPGAGLEIFFGSPGAVTVMASYEWFEEVI